jgi:hypothetical protein
MLFWLVSVHRLTPFNPGLHPVTVGPVRVVSCLLVDRLWYLRLHFNQTDKNHETE